MTIDSDRGVAPSASDGRGATPAVADADAGLGLGDAGRNVSTGDSPAAGAAPAADCPFEGSREFAQALYRALRHAERAPVRRLCWSDADFQAWPLGEAEWIASLTRWARLGGRELVMIANDYRAIERVHPRFVTWRRDWAHVVQCRLPDETRTEPVPSLWIDSAEQVLRVFDREHWRGRAGFGRADCQKAREDFDAILQRATAGFSAVTLGL